MRHWLDPLIFFHQGNVANTVECFLWVRNLSCVSFVGIFVSRPYLWESDRIGCFVAYFFCLNNLGRSKSHFYPFGETKLQQRHTQQSTGVNKLAPQHEKDYGTCGNGEYFNAMAAGSLLRRRTCMLTIASSKGSQFLSVWVCNCFPCAQYFVTLARLGWFLPGPPQINLFAY